MRLEYRLSIARSLAPRFRVRPLVGPRDHGYRGDAERAAWATHAVLGPSEGCAVYYGESPVSREMIGEVTPTQPGVIVCTKLR